ncbi:MAG: dienelactone hydrolase family protein [Silvibacterium sp.]|nr:dienelactone hydrolase family protein [Silvibacterium sp.]MBV8436091.1 dienelactone hydrolase family protein [Silvibacterium sp.]
MTMLDPHAAQPILRAGTPLDRAAGALILLHGRGGSAEDILSLGEAIADDRFALLAPQAAGHMWYPNSFLAPRRQNEPYLSSALRKVEAALALAKGAGILTDRIAIVGFSQGACLATEFVGRHPQRYAALLAYTGGLIGPLDEPITLTGSLDGTPVLFSSGDPDPHVPWQRVQQSADLFAKIGAQVFVERHPGRPHTILATEVRQGKELLSAVPTL